MVLLKTLEDGVPVFSGELNIFAEIHKEPFVLPICILQEALSWK